MPIIAAIASMFGISSFRLIAYAVIAVGVVVGALTIRQHYIDKGYDKALTKVEKQNDSAKGAAEQVRKQIAVCNDQTSYWDVITQSCKLDDDE